MAALIKTHLAVFAVVLVWDWLGTGATRAYADQSLAALPLSAVLTTFWLLGVNLCTKKQVWPTAIIGGVIGTWLGILWP